MGIKDSIKKSLGDSREISKKITDGVLPNQHLGDQNYETINQEIYSLGNTKPAFRAGKWNKRFETVKESIMKKLARNKDSIMCQVWLRDMERIFNER